VSIRITMMRQLRQGLIVSCYLDTMRGAEKAFIASVAHLPAIVALRVEGLDNIRYARQIAPDRYIIGLVKHLSNGRSFITYEEDIQNIIASGADMVATEEICWKYTINDIVEYEFLDTDAQIMLDLSYHSFDEFIDVYNNDTDFRAYIDGKIANKAIVFATTYENCAYALVEGIKRWQSSALVNIEGGVMRKEQIKKGLAVGADYVTIGKAFNDPPTIIQEMIRGVGING
jgi:putative N-acetylmannosamine-6-phosphate epimerase